MSDQTRDDDENEGWRTVGSGDHLERDRLRAENARLRDALRRIARLTDVSLVPTDETG